MPIEIKAFYSGWREVPKEQAKRFVLHLLDGSVSPNIIAIIEKKHLRGITVEELCGNERIRYRRKAEQTCKGANEKASDE